MYSKKTVMIWLGLLLLTAFLMVSCGDDKPTEPTEIAEIDQYYGGSGYDWGTTMLEAVDGNIIIAGSTDSYGSGKNTLYVIKVNQLGDTIWTRIYGGNGDDNAEAIDYTSDGGYAIAGTSSSFNGYDFYLLKINESGDKVWEKSIGQTDYFEWANGVVSVADGYVMAGYSIPPHESNDLGNVWLVKTDLNGDMVWNKTFGGDGLDWAFSLAKCNDGGFIISGYTNSFGAGDLDMYLIKTDSLGIMEWDAKFGGTSTDKAYDAIQTADGGYIACGSTRSFGDHTEQVYIIKTNAAGGKEWSKLINGESGSLFARDICKTDHNSYLITGATMVTNGKANYTEIDLSGNVIEQVPLAGFGTGMEIMINSGGDYFLTGFGYPDSTESSAPDLLMIKKNN